MNTTAIIAAAGDHVVTTGMFEQVNGHEPKSAPAEGGLTCAIWADRIMPVKEASGLASTTALLVLNVRIYTSMLQQPYDGIDLSIVQAVDALMTSYSGDFDLSGLVRNVDLFGAYGTPLGATAGYLEQDRKLYRVMTITLPMVINDAWGQAA